MMTSRPLLWPGLVVFLAALGNVSPEPGITSQGRAPATACAPIAASRELVEPPTVEIWKLPVNATGEHELTLTVHRDAVRFCYRYKLNGSVQAVAPALRVRRGEHFAIRIVNDLAGQSRGEFVSSVVLPACKPMAMPRPKATHYVGYLNHVIDDRYMHVPPIDTNIHLHGFEGPASEENIFLSTLSTPMHACEYHVVIPRTQPPGTYMYHPHAHGASDEQVALGLDGAWIVEPDKPQIPRSAEHVIVLRYRMPVRFDNLFAPNEDAFNAVSEAHEAALPFAQAVAYNPFDPPPWPVTYPMKVGGVTLDSSGCNGLSAEPLLSVDGSDAPASLQVAAETPELLRIINGSSDSATVLQLRDSAGRLKPLHVVGFDGVPVSGDMEHPLAKYVAMNQTTLTSMSRADILLTVDPGAALTLSSEHYCEGKDAFFQMHHDLLRISAAASAATPMPVLDSAPAKIADTPAATLLAFARANSSLVRRRAFTFTEYAFPKKGKIPEHDGFYITETTNPQFHEHPFWPVYRLGATVPSNPDIVVRRGALEEWYLINATMEAHAFHIHQMTFVQEKSTSGMPLMADTVFVPVGKLLPNRRDPNYPLVKPSITRLLLDFRHVPPGTFVFHCHMLFHEDRGMMAIIQVV